MNEVFSKDVLSVVADIFGIMGWSLSVVFVALWEKVFKHLFYRWKYRKVKIKNSYILILSLKKNVDSVKAKIMNQTETSLSILKGLPIQIIELPNNCTAATPKETIAKLEGVRSNMAKLQKFNVHLFCAVPLALTAFVGGFFYNKDKVLVYQKNSDTGEYECWGPIGIS